MDDPLDEDMPGDSAPSRDDHVKAGGSKAWRNHSSATGAWVPKAAGTPGNIYAGPIKRSRVFAEIVSEFTERLKSTNDLQM